MRVCRYFCESATGLPPLPWYVPLARGYDDDWQGYCRAPVPITIAIGPPRLRRHDSRSTEGGRLVLLVVVVLRIPAAAVVQKRTGGEDGARDRHRRERATCESYVRARDRASGRATVTTKGQRGPSIAFRVRKPTE